MFKYKDLKRKCCITIEGEMTIYTASDLKEKITAVLDDPRELEINLSGVSEIDSAGVQLLMLAKKNRATNQHVLTLVEHSHEALDALETLGLVPYFGDPVIVSRNGGDTHGA